MVHARSIIFVLLLGSLSASSFGAFVAGPGKFNENAVVGDCLMAEAHKVLQTYKRTRNLRVQKIEWKLASAGSIQVLVEMELKEHQTVLGYNPDAEKFTGTMIASIIDLPLAFDPKTESTTRRDRRNSDVYCYLDTTQTSVNDSVFRVTGGSENRTINLVHGSKN